MKGTYWTNRDCFGDIQHLNEERGSEGKREDKKLTHSEREKAIDAVIELVGAVDGIVQEQRKSDAEYFLKIGERSLTEQQTRSIKAWLFRAYHWQDIFSGGNTLVFNTFP